MTASACAVWIVVSGVVFFFDSAVGATVHNNTTSRLLLRGTTTADRRHLSSLSTVEYKDTKMEHIVGGNVVDNSNKYPWFVSIRRGTSHWCGGSLLSSKHVLTAAHCFDDPLYKPVKVIVNAYKRNEEQYQQHVIKTIQSVSFHPLYRNQNYEFEFDAAILIIDEVENIDSMTNLPILASPPYNNAAKLVPAKDKLVTVLGMGQSDKENSRIAVDTLKEVQLKTWSHLHCDMLYHRIREDSQVCVGPVSVTKEGADGCRGDSGGPMFAKSGSNIIIYGIVSHAAGCAKVDSKGRVWPSVFSRVSAIYEWACDMSSNEIGGCQTTQEDNHQIETPNNDMMTSDSVVIVPPTTTTMTDTGVFIDGNSNDSCGMDNDRKRLKIGTKNRQTCAWVRNQQSDVPKLCERKNVSKHCRATCCSVNQQQAGRKTTPDASDDPSFIFYDRSRSPKTCQWLNTQTMEKEVEMYCSRVSGVAEKCAATCAKYLSER